MLASGCGSSNDGPQTPKDAVNAFYKAGMDDDLDALTDATCAKYAGRASEALSGIFGENEIIGIEIASVKENGSTAVVNLSELEDGATTSNVLTTVVKENGHWAWCGDAD
ncbi:hypothetical protein CW362_19955 [Streptomyces populi]|uniref:DUF4878 domain-containing protein n=2 Tax=Streptomyces populi TaxID=2058924 RepID=A0A2I0SN10_9ACTN|nr:hypothetical protein CW362_19955 [Streptomyces populi]